MKKSFALLLAACVALGSAGCGAADRAGTANDEAPAGGAQPPGAAQSGTNGGKGAAGGEEPAKKTVYPLTVRDASGKEVRFDKPPERIASLSPSETEVLFALGLGDKIVGVDDYSNYPEEAKNKPKIGNLQGNAEAIIAANPDVVFAGLSLNKQSVDKLTELNIKLFTVEPKSLDQIMERILLYGKITDRQAQAEKLVADMRAEIKAVADAVKDVKPEEKKKVYIEFSPGWTVGSGEYMSELIDVAGGINVAADLTGWKRISEEKIIEQNPDIIFYSAEVPGLEKTIRDRSGWSQIAAIKNNRVVPFNPDLISRPGPRVTEGLREMAKAIYPDRVK
jgi:iron complex transport system substrate-binding protein